MHVDLLLTGLVLGGVAAWLAAQRRLPAAPALWTLTAAAGAALVLAIASSSIDTTAAAVAASLVVAAVAGFGLSRLTAGDEPVTGPGGALALLALTEVGVWLAVPDTEAPMALIGVFSAAGAVWAISKPPAGGAGFAPWASVAAIGALAVVAGAGTRHHVVPGALACFGVLLVVAIAPGPALRHLPLPALAAVQAAIATASARWATRSGEVAASAERAGIVLGAAVALVAVVLAISVSARWVGQARRRRSRPPARPR